MRRRACIYRRCVALTASPYLLIELHVGEYGVYAPRFREHGAEGQRETGHQQPRSGRANIRERRHARQLRIQSEKDNAAVGQHAADDNEVVQMRRRHFDVSAIYRAMSVAARYN